MLVSNATEELDVLLLALVTQDSWQPALSLLPVFPCAETEKSTLESNVMEELDVLLPLVLAREYSKFSFRPRKLPLTFV